MQQTFKENLQDLANHAEKNYHTADSREKAWTSAEVTKWRRVWLDLTRIQDELDD